MTIEILNNIKYTYTFKLLSLEQKKDKFYR